jgi:hypothetical protein
VYQRRAIEVVAHTGDQSRTGPRSDRCQRLVGALSPGQAGDGRSEDRLARAGVVLDARDEVDVDGPDDDHVDATGCGTGLGHRHTPFARGPPLPQSRPSHQAARSRQNVTRCKPVVNDPALHQVGEGGPRSIGSNEGRLHP